MPRSRLRLLLIPIAVIGLLALAAVALTPYANTRLAGALDNLFTNGLSLKAERLEVDLLGRRAWAHNLRAVHPHAPVLSVEEISLEGVSLYALVFGVEDAHLADRFLVRGAVPPQPFKAGYDHFALERAEAFELSGPFPGLLSLLREPHGRAFGPAALRMRAKVLSVAKLYLENVDSQVEAGTFIGTDFSLAGQTSLVAHDVLFRAGGTVYSVESSVMGRRVTPDPAAFLSDRPEALEAERVRMLAAGMRLEGVILHNVGAVERTVGLRGALLTAGAFCDNGSARLALSMKGLKVTPHDEPWRPFATRDESWRPLAMADGGLAADLLLEARGAGDTLRQSLRLRLENSNQARLLDFAQLNWEQENPRPEASRSFFPALEQPGPVLVRADLEVKQRKGSPGTFGSSRTASARDPDVAYVTGAHRGAEYLKEEFPDLFIGKRAAQLDAFLLSGGALRLQMEPSERLPLVLLPDALRQALPALGWKQTLNGVEAK